MKQEDLDFDKLEAAYDFIKAEAEGRSYAAGVVLNYLKRVQEEKETLEQVGWIFTDRYALAVQPRSGADARFCKGAVPVFRRALKDIGRPLAEDDPRFKGDR